MTIYTGVNSDEATQLKIGVSAISTIVTGFGRIPVNLTPVSCGASTTTTQTFTVTGVQVGDAVYVTPPSVTAGVAPVCARVSAANTVAVSFMNATAGALTPGAGLYQFMIVR